MNIKEAKEDIKNTVKLYLKKDEFGDYRIPVVRQRPVFLLGAPGIGKTAIMEQIAEELGVALVSYSMTHHTRQSALGLPFIKQKVYQEKTYDVSEYTMSEIIASVYETMEESGVKEGILFLDEINCVSETLAPSMLQFLQYKVFGKHQVPEGWVIVTAGNPPMYNKSVREFDIVTMDRLKVLEVEADYETWKNYANEKGLNPAVLSFLEIKREFFYHMETTSKGRSYITARGWEDLSEIITLYEEENIKVTEAVIYEYLRNDNVVKEFAAYYDLFQKYKNDYKIKEILAGNISENAVSKAKVAGFDERLSLLSMFLESVQTVMKDAVITSDYLSMLMPALKSVKASGDTAAAVKTQLLARTKIIANLEAANSLTKTEKIKHKKVERFLKEIDKTLHVEGKDLAEDKRFALVKAAFDKEVSGLKENVALYKKMLSNMFNFAGQAFEEGNEMLILVTELTVNKYSSRFIAMYGSEEYSKYNELLMLTERNSEIKAKIVDLKLD